MIQRSANMRSSRITRSIYHALRIVQKMIMHLSQKITSSIALGTLERKKIGHYEIVWAHKPLVKLRSFGTLVPKPWTKRSQNVWTPAYPFPNLKIDISTQISLHQKNYHGPKVCANEIHTSAKRKDFDEIVHQRRISISVQDVDGWSKSHT